MLKRKTPFTLSLQFFADSLGANVSEETAEGIALPQEGGSDEQASVQSNDQLEEEFEGLIKGGRFENAFKKRTQSIIDKRFKTLKTLEEAQAKQKPIFDLLSAKYGIDSSDTDLLLEKMQNEESGNKLTDSLKAEKTEGKILADKQVDQREALLSTKAQALARRWANEGAKLREVFPSFDFKTELQNPAFVSLLKSGLPLRKAYTAAHSDELLASAVSGSAKKAAEQTLRSIRANGSRPAENGLAGGAPFSRRIDVNSLSGEDIRSIIKQVRSGSKIRL